MTTMVELLAGIGAHLAAFELPAVASVHIAAGMPVSPVTVQLTRHTPSAVARGLVAWADTLTQVTVEAWRVPEGDSTHLSVAGLLPSGTAVRIYGGLSASTGGLGTDLAPDATTTIPLAALRHAASIEEATA
jgi:hypothetical protein